MSNNLPDELHFSFHSEFIEEAEDFFIEAKDNLFNVNHWAERADLRHMRCTLIDTHGKELRRKAHTNDFIKIIKNDSDAVLFIELIEYDDFPDDNKESFALNLTIPHDIEELGEPVAHLIVERNNTDLSAFCYFEHDNAAAILSAEEWIELLKSFLIFD
jgi:hypothetical protein